MQEYEMDIDFRDSTSRTRNDSVDFDFPMRIQCAAALDGEAFESVKNRILDVTTDRRRVLESKRMLAGSCVTSRQVRDLAELFMMDKYKLELAKSLYGHTTDRINYLEVRSVFKMDQFVEKFEHSVNEQ